VRILVNLTDFSVKELPVLKREAEQKAFKRTFTIF
tara:strand:- start:782 stop:886 length:105 start_codon:yes stop_codon:yes gene_type:complete